MGPGEDIVIVLGDREITISDVFPSGSLERLPQLVKTTLKDPGPSRRSEGRKDLGARTSRFERSDKYNPEWVYEQMKLGKKNRDLMEIVHEDLGVYPDRTLFNKWNKEEKVRRGEG